MEINISQALKICEKLTQAMNFALGNVQSLAAPVTCLSLVDVDMLGDVATEIKKKTDLICSLGEAHTMLRLEIEKVNSRERIWNLKQRENALKLEQNILEKCLFSINSSRGITPESYRSWYGVQKELGSAFESSKSVKIPANEVADEISLKIKALTKEANRISSEIAALNGKTFINCDFCPEVLDAISM